jgi:outer membrane protein assembly factor BamE
MKKLLISFFLLLSLTACALVYRPDIQQGNIIKQSTIDRLHVGMTKEQVRYLLGGCVLRPAFQANRRDYVYFVQPSHGTTKIQSVTLIFENGRLTRIKKQGFV